MKICTIVLLSLLVQYSLSGQKISYLVPDNFANSISKDEYKKLVDEAVAIVAKRYSIEEVKDGTLYLKKDQELATLNLNNLILKLADLKDKSNSSSLIQGHFANLFLSIDEQKQIDPKNYPGIKKYLSLRIYPIEGIISRGGLSSIIAKQDMEGTYTVLMLDLPGAFTGVSKDVFTLWKVDSSEVFKIAQQNVNKQEIEIVTKSFDIDGTSVEISFLGNEDYAASFALDLTNNSPSLVGEWGSVLAMPNKGLVDICKISRNKPVDFVKFIQRIKPAIEQSYKSHPQRISDQFFWYYKGKFTKITVLTDASGKINVISPFGLTQLMTEMK